MNKMKRKAAMTREITLRGIRSRYLALSNPVCVKMMMNFDLAIQSCLRECFIVDLAIKSCLREYDDEIDPAVQSCLRE